MTRSRIVLLAAGVALLLALPSLRLGFVPNDYFFLALIEGWYPSATGQPLPMLSKVAREPVLERRIIRLNARRDLVDEGHRDGRPG